MKCGKRCCIELSGASLQQADENLRLSIDRLKAGTITGRDVLEAQTIWQQAIKKFIASFTHFGPIRPHLAIRIAVN